MSRLEFNSTLARAHLIMKNLGRNFLPVFEGEQIVGVIFDQDVKRAIDTRAMDPDKALTVGNFMTSPVRAVETPEPTGRPLELLRALIASDEAKAIVLTKNGITERILFREELLLLLQSDKVC